LNIVPSLKGEVPDVKIGHANPPMAESKTFA